MAVNKTLTMSWKGVEYHVLVTMRLIDQIEEDINLVKMMARAAKDDIRYSHASHLVSMLLQSAGCPTSQEEVWEGLSDGEGRMDVVTVANLLWEIFAIVFPEPKKKDESVKKPKRQKSTRGKNSTK